MRHYLLTGFPRDNFDTNEKIDGRSGGIMVGFVPPKLKSWQKLSKKTDIKLVGYTF